MGSSDKEIKDRFEEINKRLGLLQVERTSEISEDGLYEFCRGSELFIIGSLEYLKSNTQSHRTIEVTVDGDQIQTTQALSNENYGEFTNDTISIVPPGELNFRFYLKNSIYPIGDITDELTVYFFQDRYEIRYIYGPEITKSIEKQYMTYIEPDEIREMRDLISTNILQKVSVKIDKLQE